jgi:protein-tyrosine phosphatase
LAPIRWRTIITLREAGLDPAAGADRNAASLDIADPLGKPAAEFDRAAAEIAEAVDAAIPVITRGL